MMNQSKNILPIILGRCSYTTAAGYISKTIQSKALLNLKGDNANQYKSAIFLKNNIKSSSLIINDSKNTYNRNYSTVKINGDEEGEEEEGLEIEGEEEDDSMPRFDLENEQDEDYSPEEEAKYYEQLKKLNIDTEGGRRRERRFAVSDKKREEEGEGKEPVENEDESALTRVYMSELHDAIMNYPLHLYKEVRYQLHKLWKEDPEFWNYEKLSKVFKLHPGRVVALIRYVEMEDIKREKGGRLYYDLENHYFEVDGVRLEDEYLGEEDMKQQRKDQYRIRSGLSENIEFLHGKKNPKTLAEQSQKPDPLHEVPVKIPDNYEEKPIYFRGPTFVVPRKKNVVFVDTSRDRFTKKVNPDPMVLIQGIDGSLRTPSSKEKVQILQKVRPKKVQRDYQSLLNRPIIDEGKIYNHDVEKQKLADQAALAEQQEQQQS